MSELKTTYTQECDLCHKVVETDKYGLKAISVPYATRVAAKDHTSLTRLNLCPSCYDRLGRIMVNYLDFENRAWKDDELE